MVASTLIDSHHGAGLFLPGIEGKQVATDGCNRRALRGALSTRRQRLARPEDATVVRVLGHSSVGDRLCCRLLALELALPQ